ncbi:TPA: hypothetical protein MO340_004257 [Salmonella enterica subsp. salamae serovar 35:g,m,s,t:-]|nr:hypothetical protein [Salmonella enterica subsp. salamae serovar 35:g,m,s,t:-]HCA3549727.1 hypothetical protein [Salmonella enterica subsp. salamae serovar 35:g,m,s,t:-]
MSDSDDLNDELNFSALQEGAEHHADPAEEVAHAETTSRLHNKKIRSYLSMGAIAVLALAIVYGPDLFSSRKPEESSLKDISPSQNGLNNQKEQPQQSPTENNQVYNGQSNVQPQVSSSSTDQSEIKGEVAAMQVELTKLEAKSDTEIDLLRQLVAQTQQNSQAMLAQLQKGSVLTASCGNSVAPAAAKQVKAVGNLHSQKHTPKQSTHEYHNGSYHSPKLPPFSINTIYTNEAWLKLGSLTYAVKPGDQVMGIRIIGIDPENHTVTTSAGDIH